MISLECQQVGRRYGANFWALQDVSFKLTPGVLGLLGPNGAGKSSLMRILATITKATTGTVLWNGADLLKQQEEVRRVVGYLPQDFGVYPNLNAIEFLQYMAALKGLNGAQARKRIDELLVAVNLAQSAKRPIGGYSGGMRQRVGIAQALLNDPQLLIVDEPTVGLDPEERVRFRNLLQDLSGERIIILSTHIVSDIEASATYIAIMQAGHLLSFGLPEQILKAVEDKVWEWQASSTEIPALKERFLLSGAVRRADGVRVRVVHDSAPYAQAHQVAPTLEDAYLYTLQQYRLQQIAQATLARS